MEAFNLSNVSLKYYEFTNIFSKAKAKVLAPHCSYNSQINLEEDTQSLVGPIYSLLMFKQEALKNFIEENLNMGFHFTNLIPTQYTSLIYQEER